MRLIRTFEDTVRQQFQKGDVHGTTHLYSGQEASGVGVCSMLRAGDKVAGTYRGHGHSIGTNQAYFHESPNWAQAERSRGIRRPPGVILHTTTRTLGPSEVVSREGIRVTDPVRSILDAAAAGTAPEQIEVAVGQALDEGLATRRSLLGRADRGRGRVVELVRRSIGTAGRS